VSISGGEPVRLALGPRLTEGAAVHVAIRPESLQIIPDGAAAMLAPSDGVLGGKLADLTFLGNLIDCHVVLDDGTRVRVQADPGSSVQLGQALRLRFDGHACTVFEA
jgi:ABC-type Fe3+/spermidine/putrescine transport system ATPase subunit